MPVVVVVCFPYLQIDFSRLSTGVSQLWAFIERLFTKPDATYFPTLLGLMWETILLSFVATVAACIISFPIGLLAARNCSPHPVVGYAIKAVASVVRAMPDLLLALILAGSLGLGDVPGVIALTITSAAFLIKMYAEALEVVDRKAVEGITASGGDWMAQRTIGVVPQAAQDMIGLSLYAMDSNLRSAAILGAVGAGGIGYDLSQAVRLFHFDRLGAIIVAIYLSVGIVDMLSSVIRRRIG
jgi:phosphonate transport system permease protein